MSAVRGKADVPATWPGSPFVAISRHESLCEWRSKVASNCPTRKSTSAWSIHGLGFMRPADHTVGYTKKGAIWSTLYRAVSLAVPLTSPTLSVRE